MKVLHTIGALAVFLSLAGCSNPADGVPTAEVSAATEAPNEKATLDDGNTRYYSFGPSSSAITFIGSKVTGSHEGGFRNFAGELAVLDGKLVNAGTKVVIDINSIWSDNDRLTGHLKSPDFFDAAQFPTAVFETVSIEPSSTNWTVTGHLTMHGITKQISFPATIQMSEEQVAVAAEFALNRFDFEMKYPGKADDLIRKEVVLKLDIKAAPGRADFSIIQTAAQADRGATVETKIAGR